MTERIPRRLDFGKKLLLPTLGLGAVPLVCGPSIVLLLSLCPRIALAQSPSQAPPQLSPQAAYDQAMRPLEITRGSIQNWSDSELAALTIAIGRAKDGCLARSPSQFTGEDLLAFARLCSLGQQWPTVRDAATLYIDEQRQASPAEKLSGISGLAEAYAYQVGSSLKLNDPQTALTSAREMLRSVPYNSVTSEATTSTIRYLQLIRPSDAFLLLAQRQPILLSLLRSQYAHSSSAATTQQPLTIHALYSDAIELPAFLQFNKMVGAAAAIAALEATLPTNLSADDTILIAETRRQYDLLGASLPAISSWAYLLHSALAAPPNLNTNFGSATVFLLFPDWCSQCIHMGPEFTKTAARLKTNGVRFYALLAQAAPPPPAPKSVRSSRSKSVRSAPPMKTTPDPQPKTAVELLSDTPTLVVSSELIKKIAANDFPFIIVTDHQGIVRFLQAAPDTALVPGGLVDQVIARIIEQWPPPRNMNGG